MHADEDEIDLKLVFARIWKMRKFVLTGTMVIVLIAFMANEFFAKYQSEGHFKINNFTPTAYRLYQPSIFNADRFRVYATEIGLKDSESVAFLVRLLSLSPDQFEQYASIVRSVTPKDSKENVTAKGKDKEAEVGTLFIGLDLKIPGPSPEAAQLRSQIFAEYFVDSTLYTDLGNWLEIAGQLREATAYSNKIETIKAKRSIDDANIRLDALRSLIKSFPDALRLGVQQTISVASQDETSTMPNSTFGSEHSRTRSSREKSERFMSPVAQIVAAESLITDEKIDLKKLLRKQRQSDLAYEFYKQATLIRSTTNSGRELLKKLTLLHEGIYHNISANDEASVEVLSEISHELEQRQLGYASGFKFLAGPTLPDAKSKKNPVVVAFSAGASGVSLMIILALLMSWWRQNGKSIIRDDRAIASAR
jgi:hypothetical protein